MSKAVFITKVNPTYDDLPEGRYHFPRQYLNQVKRAVGDLIVYHEPRRQDSDDRGREGRQAYFATARVESIEEDPLLRNHFYARISEYLEFDQPVPFRTEQLYFESSLQKEDGSTNRGAFGRSVRIVPDDEFENILRAGFAPVIGDQRITKRPVPGPGFQEDQIDFQRSFVEQVVRRPFRDSAFARNVAAAYDQTCAMTGLKIINGGGRAEVEAAHIQPVGDDHNGPDSIRNGIGLSRTAHWMFDRGLVSISDEFEILVSGKLSPDAKTLLNPDGQIRLPGTFLHRPHSKYLRYHRENIYKD